MRGLDSIKIFGLAALFFFGGSVSAQADTLFGETSDWQVFSNADNRLCYAMREYPTGSFLYIVLWEDKFNVSLMDEFLRFKEGFEKSFTLTADGLAGTPFQVRRPFTNQILAHFTFSDQNDTAFFQRLKTAKEIVFSISAFDFPLSLAGYADAQAVLDRCLAEVL